MLLISLASGKSRQVLLLLRNVDVPNTEEAAAEYFLYCNIFLVKVSFLVSIHCAALRGSLNANTLAGKVTAGLSERDKTNKDDVVGMMDGCYTNGAAQDTTNHAAALSNDLQRFVSLCVSHLSNNAGEKATVPILEYVWSLLMKVFSTSEITKGSYDCLTNKHVSNTHLFFHLSPFFMMEQEPPERNYWKHGETEACVGTASY